MADPTPAWRTPRGTSVVIWVATALLTLIVFTGALVRLTESGLGCEDWPTCSEERVVPEFGFHAWIEFGNRLLSGLVAVGTLATVVAARRRIPYRADLERWSWFLVLGVAAQVVLGGVTVLVDLHPLFVSSHFLLSMVLLWAALVLAAKASGGDGPAIPRHAPALMVHSRTTVVAAAVLLVSGTVVTGTGPNSGDFSADRFSFDLEQVARVHGVIAWTVVALLVTLALRFRRAGVDTTGVQRLLALAVVQGAVGYLQYSLGVPPALVMVHVIGAVSVWMAVVWFDLRQFDRPSVQGPEASVEAGSPVEVG